jgi:DNA-binding CsgD family transcriptional regulator
MGFIAAELAHAYTWQGELARAETLLADALPLDALNGQSTLTLTERDLTLQWARLELRRGHSEGALEILAHLYETLRKESQDPPIQGQTIPELLLVEGVALTHLRQWEKAEQALESARHGATQRMTPSSQWVAHVGLARLYRATKREELAHQQWMAAHGVVERLATTIDEADLRNEFLQAALADFPQGARVSHAHTIARPATTLTPRERQVAELIAQGSSNRQIADVLVVSERTVTTHVSNILGKLGFTSRTQIVTWLLEGAAGKP